MSHAGIMCLCSAEDVCLQFESDMTFVANAYNAVEHFYVKGVPQHMHKDTSELSVFQIMKHDELMQLSPGQSLEILHHKHIVVMDVGHVNEVSFDADGLRTVSENLTCQITIHGMYFS